MAEQKKSRGSKSTAKRSGLPKTALKAADSVHKTAASESAVPETKASGLKSAFAKALEPKLAKPAAKKAEVEAPAPLFEAAAAVSPALAVEFVAKVAEAAPIPSAEDVIAPASRFLEAGAEQAREVYARARVTTDTFRNAVTETANLSTRGALEVNGKVIDALRAQSDAAFDLWRSALTAESFSEAIQNQATGTRQFYETTAAHWKDVADTARRWFGETVAPMQSAWVDRAR